MPEYLTSAQRVSVERWPECGEEALAALVGPDRLLMAKDGTPYVIVASGHPTRVFDGWAAVRDSDGVIRVVAKEILKSWLRQAEPQR